MKKIAIISFNHPESTLPLVKYLSKLGYKVDYYFITYKGFEESSAFEFGEKAKIGIHLLKNPIIKRFYTYFENIDSKIYLITPTPTLESYGNILNKFGKLIQKFHLRTILRIHQICKYDYVNIVGQEDLLIEVHKILKNNIVIHSLHEVCNHYSNENNESKLINYLGNNNLPIILHSNKTHDDYYNFIKNKSNNVRIIPFGLFETYKIFINSKRIKLFDFENNYLLFFGRILPYKGIKVLIEAIDKIDIKILKDIKIVIAGSGDLSDYNYLKNDKRYIIINRHLSNGEIVDLNVNAKIVICPYISASQSGITQTSFLFSKPVIASNIGGFKEIINNNENGILFKVNESTELSEILINVLTDSNLYNKLVEGVNIFNSSNNKFNWHNIAHEYESYFKDIEKL